MARQATWTNSDGLVVGFGPRDSKNNAGATVRTMGNEEQFSMILDYDTLPAAAGTAPSSKSIPLPANSMIHEATLRVIVAFTSGGATTLDIGLVNSAGTAIDQDGIDAAIAKTAIDAIGEVVQCDGALVNGTATVGTSDAYISCNVGTGPYTAGQAELTVRYSRPLADTTPTDPISGIVGSL